MSTTATLPPQAGRSCSSEVKPFSVTQAMRAKLAKELQASFRGHVYRRLVATYKSQVIDAVMGKADCDNAFADVDWGKRMTLAEARRFAPVYLMLGSERLVRGFDKSILPHLRVANRLPLTAEMEWCCTECRKHWSVTLIQGRPLAPVAWVCQDCGEQPYYL